VAADTEVSCAGKLVEGSGKPSDEARDGWRLRELLCLKKSAKMLCKLARNAGRCQHRASRDDSRNGAFDLDECLDTVLTRT
jgi:hypothetical protein